MTLPEGAIGLLGPNGAGKTTMIRTLLGLITLDAGQGRVLGMDIRTRRLDIRQAVGFVPEDECLFPGVVGVEFVAYAGELVGMHPSDALQRAHEVLDYVGLGEARYRRVESYSTGMKQRLKIASAIVHDPRLLILDEPTNGMDPAGREEILGAGPRPVARQGDEPALLQPPAARRRGGLRPRRGAGPGPAAGPGADRRAQAASRPPVRGAGQGRPARASPAGWPSGASRPSPHDDHLLVQLPPGATAGRALGDRRPGRASRSVPCARGGARSKRSS